MSELKDYEMQDVPNWCVGCGNIGILAALKQAFVKLGNPQEMNVVVSEIGCSSKLPYWIRVNAFDGLHGRTLPVAQAVKLANNNLNVVGISGDGGAYGEGGNHFIAACRRNINMTYLVHNNQVFALTTGQYSPTSERGYVSKTSPQGSTEQPYNPLVTAIASGATFVARGFAWRVPHLTELIVAAMKHKGFAIIDIIQPCVTWKKYHEIEKKVYELEKTGYKPVSKDEAIKLAMDEERIAIGILYDKAEQILEHTAEHKPEIDDIMPQYY